MRGLYAILKPVNGYLERAVNYINLFLLLAFIVFIIYQVLSRSFAVFPTLFFHRRAKSLCVPMDGVSWNRCRGASRRSLCARSISQGIEA